MTINFGGCLVHLPLDGDATLRKDVRRTYRDWRKTHDRYYARTMAERCALWYAATSHPCVTYGRNVGWQ